MCDLYLYINISNHLNIIFSKFMDPLLIVRISNILFDFYMN